MKKNTNGFTLIEMIVVIVVVAILTAIAMPSVLRYIEDAKDAKLLVQARNVLTAAKAKSMDLYIHDRILSLDKDQAIWEEIVADAQVDGTLKNLDLNAQKNSSGDFILAIAGKYVYYIEEKERFEVDSELHNTASFTKKLHDSLISSSSLLEQIKTYFKNHPEADSLDSEGVNFGLPIKNALAAQGFDPDLYSFRVEYRNGSYSLTITEKKITNELSGQSIQVVQYNYGNNFFTGDYEVKHGEAQVSDKNVEGNQIPYLDLSHVVWSD